MMVFSKPPKTSQSTSFTVSLYLIQLNISLEYSPHQQDINFKITKWGLTRFQDVKKNQYLSNFIQMGSLHTLLLTQIYEVQWQSKVQFDHSSNVEG